MLATHVCAKGKEMWLRERKISEKEYRRRRRHKWLIIRLLSRLIARKFEILLNHIRYHPCRGHTKMCTQTHARSICIHTTRRYTQHTCTHYSQKGRNRADYLLYIFHNAIFCECEPPENLRHFDL